MYHIISTITQTPTTLTTYQQTTTTWTTYQQTTTTLSTHKLQQHGPPTQKGQQHLTTYPQTTITSDHLPTNLYNIDHPQTTTTSDHLPTNHYSIWPPTHKPLQHWAPTHKSLQHWAPINKPTNRQPSFSSLLAHTQRAYNRYTTDRDREMWVGERLLRQTWGRPLPSCQKKPVRVTLAWSMHAWQHSTVLQLACQNTVGEYREQLI